MSGNGQIQNYTNNLIHIFMLESNMHFSLQELAWGSLTEKHMGLFDSDRMVQSAPQIEHQINYYPP